MLQSPSGRQARATAPPSRLQVALRHRSQNPKRSREPGPEAENDLRFITTRPLYHHRLSRLTRLDHHSEKVSLTLQMPPSSKSANQSCRLSAVPHRTISASNISYPWSILASLAIYPAPVNCVLSTCACSLSARNRGRSRAAPCARVPRGRGSRRCRRANSAGGTSRRAGA